MPGQADRFLGGGARLQGGGQASQQPRLEIDGAREARQRASKGDNELVAHFAEDQLRALTERRACDERGVTGGGGTAAGFAKHLTAAGQRARFRRGPAERQQELDAIELRSIQIFHDGGGPCEQRHRVLGCQLRARDLGGRDHGSNDLSGAH